jgi:putative transposase
MGLLFALLAHLLVTLARLIRPGGIRAVAAESLAVKHQLLIMKRSQRRGPNLTAWDRVILGFCTLLISPRRLTGIAVILKTSTLLRLHRALVKRKYRLLYSSRRCRRPGPKGPSRELIDAVVEMKRRNPYLGCRKIAEQIANAFGIELNKDVVCRILIRYYRPAPSGDGPSWLATIARSKDRLWSVDLFRTESILLKSYWVMVVMDVYTRRIIGFGVDAAHLDGSGSAGCSIVRSHDRLCPGIFPRTMIGFSVFIAGWQTCGCSKSTRSRPFPIRHVRMLSWSD